MTEAILQPKDNESPSKIEKKATSQFSLTRHQKHVLNKKRDIWDRISNKHHKSTYQKFKENVGIFH